MKTEPRLYEVYAINRIVVAVTEKTGVSKAEICSRRRDARTSEARDRVAHAAHVLEIPATVIGGYLGRDHSTVLDMIKRQIARMEVSA